MRKNLIAGIAAVAALMSPAFAADMPYTPIDVPPMPPVDYGLGDGFYLRGSVAGNGWWATDGVYCACITTFDTPGYGYSLGVGFGYENGSGFRTDVTFDYLSNWGLHSTTDHTVSLKSGLLMANAYYDFSFDGHASAAGGFGGYVGAGLGLAKNYSQVFDNTNTEIAWGTSLEGAAAIMTGVTYDMGQMVADVGYRGIYMNKVMSQPPLPADAYIINNNFIHEIRGTLRYRLQ